MLRHRRYAHRGQTFALPAPHDQQDGSSDVNNNRELTTREGSADSTTFSDCIFGHDSLKRLKHTTDVRYYRFRDYLDKVRGWRNEEAHSAPEIPDAELREAVNILVTMYAYVIAKSLPDLEG